MVPIEYRVGEGWDVHALVPGRRLVIGGVEIPFHAGLLGHSDADVLLHAITDALLGAAGMGDIGTLFPDSDPQWAGADSIVLLTAAHEKIQTMGWRVSNIDCTVIAQAPKLGPLKTMMQKCIANALNIDASCVNVKGKTAEKLGPVGMGHAIEARAVAMIYRAK
jgi:2-C-methyl-D-erythritol 2,4-cyclodiphosphate synthase